MREILLTQGMVALVDDEDFHRINLSKWTFSNGYAMRKQGRKTIYMHREVMSTPKEMYTDHKDHDGCNNQKANLRICTQSQNQHNHKIQKNSTSGYKGVTWWKRDKKWMAQIKCNYKRHHIGYFLTPIEAAQAYDKKAKELFGEFANTNF